MAVILKSAKGLLFNMDHVQAVEVAPQPQGGHYVVMLIFANREHMAITRPGSKEEGESVRDAIFAAWTDPACMGFDVSTGEQTPKETERTCGRCLNVV